MLIGGRPKALALAEFLAVAAIILELIRKVAETHCASAEAQPTSSYQCAASISLLDLNN